jgi:sugar transferase (PEP-CTERM/EpsH1 system associated)
MKPKKIMHVTSSLNVGGLEVLLLEMLKKLDRGKFSPSVCTFDTRCALRSEFDSAGVPVYVIEKRPGIDLLLPFKLRDLFLAKGIEIVHSHNFSPWLYSALGARLGGIPRIFHTEHSNVDAFERKANIELFLSFITRRIISDSRKVTDFMTGVQKINMDKIRTILNGIDVDRYGPGGSQGSGKADLGLDADDFLIGTVSRLVKVKDLITLLTAFNLVLRTVKNASLIIVGEGETRMELEEFIRDNGLSGRVKLLGARRDIPELLKLMDVFVLSSLSEGLSISLIEAMASEVPVVVTNVGGNPEVVIDKVTGFLVPVRSPDKMADAIVSILNNAGLADTFGKAGRERVMTTFNLNTMVREYEKVYEESYAVKKSKRELKICA